LQDGQCGVWVRVALRGVDARTVRWRLELLARARSVGVLSRSKPRSDGDGVDIKVGPFVLRSSGRPGQSVEQFCAEVDRAKESLNSLLWCFACLAASQGHEPEENLEVAHHVRDFLEQRLHPLKSRSGTAACTRAEVLSSALNHLAQIIEESQPLSEAHRRVFTSAAAVLTPKQCRRVIKSAEQHASTHGWTRDRHMAYPTNDLPVTAAVLGSQTAEVLCDAVNAKLLPELAELFNLERSKLGIQEMFVAKYEPIVAGGLPGLEEHEDGSEFSFVLSLNDGQRNGGGVKGEFDGGGTRFVHLDGQPTYRPPLGYATLFSGKNRHCGVATTRGVRYILAGFLRYG